MASHHPIFDCLYSCTKDQIAMHFSAYMVGLRPRQCIRRQVIELEAKQSCKPQKNGLARLEAEVVYSEHICSGKMLLLLSHWSRSRGAEASFVTDRQEATSDFSQLSEALIHQAFCNSLPAQNWGWEAVTNSTSHSLAKSCTHVRSYYLANPKWSSADKICCLFESIIQSIIKPIIQSIVQSIVQSPGFVPTL